MNAVATPNPVSDVAARQIRAQQVRLLYEQAPLGAAASLLIAPLLALVLWDTLPRAVLAIWFLALVATILVRLALTVAFHLGGRRKFDVQLAIAELVLGPDFARAWFHFHVTVADNPRRRRAFVTDPLREVRPIEKNDRIRRRLAGLVRGAEGAGRDPFRLRPV